MDERKTRRRYDRAFKEGAVRLVIENGQTLAGTARDLGITENMLTRWKQEYLEDREQVFPGRITYIGDTLNPATRTVEVRCETQNREGKLKPEMYATIGFGVGEVTNALLVPTVAVQDVEGQSTVFIRESDTRFRARKIRVGRQAGSQSEVLEGLSPGEVVVSAGSFLLKSELLKANTAAE